MDEQNSIRASNLQRAQWRQKCRETLANHIKCSIGLYVEPIHVRLVPDAQQDGYTWSVLPARSHLFKKQLSKHSVGAYMELCREVGKSFEAVRSSASTHPPADCEPQETRTTDSDTSFSAIISCLEEKNRDLITELSHLKKVALEDSEARQRLENRQEASEADLRAARTEIEQLRDERGKLHAQLKRYSKRLHKSEREIRVAFCAIQRCGLNIGQSISNSRKGVTKSDGE